MRTPNPRWPAFFRLLPSLAAALLAAPLSFAQFIPSTPGTYDFNNPANWTGGVINGQFSGDLNAIWTTTATDLTLGGFSWNHTGLTGASPSLRADGTGDRTLTINNGTITLTTGSGFLTAMLGNGLAGSRLFVDLAGTTSISTPTNTVFSLQNDATFSGTITKTGVGRIDTFGNVNVSGSLALNSGTLNVGGGVLSVTGSLTLGSGAHLDLFSNGSLSGNVSTASGSSVSFNNNADQTYSGVISGGGSLLKYGTGVLTLSATGALTGGYTGFTTVGVGTLRTTGDNSQAPTSQLSVSGGTTLDVQNNLNLRALTSSGSVVLGTGTTLGLGDGVSSGGSFSGVISGDGALAIAVKPRDFGSVYAQTLTGNNSFSGGVSLNSGTLVIGHDNALGTGTLAFNGGVLATTGGARVVANPFTIATTLSVSGSAWGQTGDLTLTHNHTLAGDRTVEVVGTASGTKLTLAGNLDGAGRLISTGGGTLVLSGNNTHAGTTITGGTVEFSSLANFGSQLTLNSGYLRWAAGNTADISPVANPALGGLVYLHTNGNNVTLGGSFSGTGGLGKAGTGTLTLTGASTYTGITTIDGGTLAIGAANALPTTTNPQVAAGATLAVNANQTVAGLAGAGSVVLGSGSTLTLNIAVSSTPTTAISGDGALAKSGSGTITLNNSNTYTGGTTLNAGFLTIGANDALGSGTLTFNGGTLNASGTRVLANAFAFTGTGRTGGTLTLSSAHTLTGTPNLEVGSGTTTLSGVLDGSGSLTKSGSGTLVLSGTNTYTGGTTLTAGTLAVTSDANLGATSGALTLATNATLRGDATATISRNVTLSSGTGNVNTNGNNLELSGVISGAGGLTKQGSGALTLSGANTYTGNTVTGSSGGSLILAGDQVVSKETQLITGGFTTMYVNGNTLVRGITVSSGGTLNIAAGKTLTVRAAGGNNNGQITGSGALTIGTGDADLISGAVTLGHASNNYTGATLVTGNGTSGARLRVNGAITASHVTVNNAGELSGGGTVASLTLDNLGFINPGTLNARGNLTISGNASWLAGAGYRWEFSDGSGTAGNNTGWDLLTVNGALNFATTADDAYTFSLRSFTNANAVGLAANFNSAASASFLVASAAGGITGFASNAWTVDASLFQNSFTGSFSLSQTGNNLYLNYTAIPEPSTYAALAGVLALGLATWRRRTAA